jgi:hypothetical protein
MQHEKKAVAPSVSNELLGAPSKLLKDAALTAFISGIIYILVGTAFTFFGVYTWTLTFTGAIACGVATGCGNTLVNSRRST